MEPRKAATLLGIANSRWVSWNLDIPDRWERCVLHVYWARTQQPSYLLNISMFFSQQVIAKQQCGVDTAMCSLSTDSNAIMASISVIKLSTLAYFPNYRPGSHSHFPNSGLGTHVHHPNFGVGIHANHQNSRAGKL